MMLLITYIVYTFLLHYKMFDHAGYNIESQIEKAHSLHLTLGM